MKKLLLLLLVTLSCFNLAGGYAIAATALSQASASAEKPTPHHPNQHVVGKASADLLMLQVSKCELQEDDSMEKHFRSMSTSRDCCRFSSDFKQNNRYFLVHYAAAIKDKFPAAYLLYHNYRL